MLELVEMSPLDELRLLLRPAGGGLYLVSTGKAEQVALQKKLYGAHDDASIRAKFEDNLARIATAEIVVLGIPSDIGAGFRRGANLGPQALRTEILDDPAWRQVLDIGDVFVVPQLLTDDMLSPDQLARSRAALYPNVAEALPVAPLSIAERALGHILAINPRVKPLMLGGDHSTAWPVVKALHDAGRRFCIVQIDAHTDLLEERLGVRICFATWSYHANDLIGRNRRMIQVGIRATRFSEEHWEKTLDVEQVWATEVARDPAAALDAVISAAKATGLPAYFSNDIDGTDAAFADATGTPEPNGLSVDFVRTLVRRLGDEVGLMGADVVEVAPVLGPNGGRRTLETAALYLKDTIAALRAGLD